MIIPRTIIAAISSGISKINPAIINKPPRKIPKKGNINRRTIPTKIVNNPTNLVPGPIVKFTIRSIIY